MARIIDGLAVSSTATMLKALRINRLLVEPQVMFDDNKLTADEQSMRRCLDWRSMIQYGVSFFLLEKLGAVVGVSNLHIGSAMRGETLAEFQKTRNQQVTYSVAGKAKA